MNHDGTSVLTVGVYVGQIETDGELEVQLYGGTLPGTSYGIRDVKIELWSVECAVTGVEFILSPQRFKGFNQRCLCLVPQSLVPHEIVRPGRQFDLVGHVKRAVDHIDQFQHVLDLLSNLVLAHKQMGIILMKTPYPQRPVKRTRGFKARQRSVLRQLDGQIPI